MNELSRERLISLLADDSQQVTNKEMQSAYGCFMEQINEVSQSEKTYSEIFRMLNIIRVELVSIETLYQYGQGGKCLEICSSSKSISTCQC